MAARISTLHYKSTLFSLHLHGSLSLRHCRLKAAIEMRQWIKLIDYHRDHIELNYCTDFNYTLHFNTFHLFN